MSDKHLFMARYGPEEDLEKNLDHSDPDVQFEAASSFYVKKHHLPRLLTSEDQFVRSRAAAHSDISPDQLAKTMKDFSWLVRMSGLRNPKATHDQLVDGTNDSNSAVKETAKEVLLNRRKRNEF